MEHNISFSIFPRLSILSDFRWLWCESDICRPGLQKRKQNSAGDWLVFTCLIGVRVSLFPMIIIYVLFRLSLTVRVCWGVSHSGQYGVTFFQGSDLSFSMHPMMKRSTAQDFKSYVYISLTEGLQKKQMYLTFDRWHWKVLRVYTEELYHIILKLIVIVLSG